MKFRFREIPKVEQVQRLETICSYENISIEQSALMQVIEVSEGDLRKALNLLQMADSVKTRNKNLSVADINFISDTATVKDVYDSYLRPYQILAKQRIENLEEQKLIFVEKIIQDGNTAQQIVTAFYKHMERQTNFTELQKARLVINIVDAQSFILKGVDDASVLNLFFNLCLEILRES